MSDLNYKIYKLTDYQRLFEISKLTKDAFSESGLILQNYNNQYLNLYPHLNTIQETSILIAEINRKIIGTNSVTLDGPAGLHTDYYFKKETDFIRKTEDTVLGSSWRIATTQEYRNNIRLFLDLVQNTFIVTKKKNIETCLFVFAEKHEAFYKKMLDAETIAKKKYTKFPYNNVTFVLMKTNTENSQKHLSELFTRRKFY